MVDIVSALVEKAGLTQEQAEKAVDVITGTIKEQVPMLAGMVDNFLGRGGADGAAPPDLSGLFGGFTGMMGGKDENETK